MSDIEDFTTAALLAEVTRRITAAESRQCWYCRRNVNAHTCKYAEVPRYRGWTVEPPARHPDGRWRTTANRTADGVTAGGIATTRDGADVACFGEIDRIDQDTPASLVDIVRRRPGDFSSGRHA